MSATEKERKKERVCIIGTGNYGIALAKRLIEFGFHVIFGSRNPNKDYLLKCLDASSATNFDVDTIGNAFLAADRLVFFAVSAKSGVYENICSSLSKAIDSSSSLQSKIIIDLSNQVKKRKEKHQHQQSNAERLQQLLNDDIKSARVVVLKAFNTISAYSMSTSFMEKKGSSGMECVLIAGDDNEAKASLIKFCQQIGFAGHDVGGLKRAGQLESESTRRAFDDWFYPSLATLGFVVFNYVWIFFHYFIFPSTPKSFGDYVRDHSVMSHLNKVLGFSALQLLAYVYLASVVASVYQLKYGTKYKRFPLYLDCWLRARKQLGLWAFLLACIHMLLSVLTSGPGYLKSWYKLADKVSKFTLIAELSFLSGTLAFVLLALVALSSLNSVANSLSWREWRFVQSKLGITCLVVSILHSMIMFSRMLIDADNSTTVAYLVTRVKFLAFLVPLLVVLLRIVFGCFPPLSKRIERIRDGSVDSNETDLKI